MYVDDINLLDDDLVTMLLQSITDGFVIVEREGISVKYPCKPILIATLNPEDSELKDVFLDRIGIALNSDLEELTMDERVEAVSKVLKFSDGKIDTLSLADIYEKEEQLKSTIIFAREYIKETKISSEQLMYLCEESSRGGCQGHRAGSVSSRSLEYLFRHTYINTHIHSNFPNFPVSSKHIFLLIFNRIYLSKKSP